MDIADLNTASMRERWRSLTSEQQEAIGIEVLGAAFADLVAEDDGLMFSDAERAEAAGVAQTHFGNIRPAVEAVFPGVMWAYPEGTHYEARDARGRILGRVETIDYDRCQCVPAAATKRPSKPVKGLPWDCIPA